MKILDKRQLFLFGRTMLLLSGMSALCSLGRHESKILILCKTALSPIWHGCHYMFSTNDWCDKLHMLKGDWGKSFFSSFFFPQMEKICNCGTQTLFAEFLHPLSSNNVSKNTTWIWNKKNIIAYHRPSFLHKRNADI